jgi:prepilin-type N-terminal cleavage/methylation domain-containing protein
MRANRHSFVEQGVTLLELLIVATLIAVVVGLSFPSAAAGVDSLRVRSAGDKVVAFLDTAIDRAERRQQVVEIRISPGESALSARSADASFNRTLELSEPVRIVSIDPPLLNGGDPTQQRRFLLYPGGTAPRIVINLETRDGRKRRVIVDPVTGLPHSEQP